MVNWSFYTIAAPLAFWLKATSAAKIQCSNGFFSVTTWQVTTTSSAISRYINQYYEHGYFTVQGLFTAEEVEAVRNEITKIVGRYPYGPEGLVEFEPSVESGENSPEEVELGVRKLST